MRSYSAQRTIGAPPDAVWAFLTDPAALTATDTGITRIEGSIAAGARFKLWSEATGDRAFAIAVTVFDPPRRMVWHSGMPLGLFSGTRRFELARTPEGTQLSMREDFTGLLAGPITRSMPDLTPFFERFVAAAKHHAEEGEMAA